MAVELLAGEAIAGESNKAILACNDYLRMGIGRSLSKLQQIYIGTTTPKPPTTTLRTLGEWSAVYGWQARADAYDKLIDAEKTSLAEVRRKEVMESGLALEYERVAKLKRLAAQLEAQIYYSPGRPESAPDGWDDEDFEHEAAREQGDPRVMYPLIWVEDVKGIGKGDDFERVEIVRFNTPLISEYRATLDDIAKETGGRKQKTEFSTEDGKPLPISIVKMPVDEL